MADELKLAPSTVHRALSGHPSVSLNTRRKVLCVSQEKGYLLPIHETGNIAIIVPDFSVKGYLGCLLPHLNTEIHRRGFRMLVVSKADIALLGDRMFDGIVSLVWQEGLEKSLPQNFAVPILMLNATSNTLENIPRIASDPQGIRLALEYLHSRGCRKIFYVSTVTKDSLDSAERLAEFRQFCLKTGQDYESLHLETHWSEIEGNMPRILKARPDACFCASETYAAQIGQLLKKKGMRIPQDISLMGLEDKHGNECFTPPITAIRQNFERIAAVAAENVVGKINDGIPMKGCRIPFTLIERESVRKPKRR